VPLVHWHDRNYVSLVPTWNKSSHRNVGLWPCISPLSQGEYFCFIYFCSYLDLILCYISLVRVIRRVETSWYWVANLLQVLRWLHTGRTLFSKMMFSSLANIVQDSHMGIGRDLIHHLCDQISIHSTKWWILTIIKVEWQKTDIHTFFGIVSGLSHSGKFLKSSTELNRMPPLYQLLRTYEK